MERIGLILSLLLALPQIVKFTKNTKTMETLNLIWNNITLILMLIGVIIIIYILLKHWIVTKYNQKANKLEIPDISDKADKDQIINLQRYIRSTMDDISHNMELFNNATKDIASASSIEDLKKRFGGMNYIIRKIEDYEPNHTY